MKFPKTIKKIHEMNKRPHGMMAYDGWEKEIEDVICEEIKNLGLRQDELY